MRRHRTTARGILLIAIVGLTAAPAAARLDPGQLPKRAPSSDASDKTIGNAPGKRIIFPVLGKFRYSNSFGDPRGQGAHQGIDIMAPRKALALAAEAGKAGTTSRPRGRVACSTSTATAARRTSTST